MEKITAALDRYFHFTDKGSDLKTELLAGLTTFMTMLYIVPVNAFILSKAGMPMDALVTAIAVMTIFSTLLTGLWANTPIAMSVGLGLSTYFTFGLVQGQGVPWETALGVVTLSGTLFLVLAFTPFRRWIIQSIPDELKRAISAGIGAFIAFIALKQMGVVVASEKTLVTLGNLRDPSMMLGIFGLLFVFWMSAWGLRGAFVLSILVTSATGWVMGVVEFPTEWVAAPASLAPIALKLDLVSAFNLALLPVIITFMITDILDSLGTLAGVGYRANLFSSDESVALQRTLEVDAAASAFSGMLGVSTTTAFVESAAGVEAGGRTGLTSVVTALLFVTTLFLLPLFKAIPENAIYPVLVMVGVYMFSELKNARLDDITTAIPAFLIVILMPLTFSVTTGLAVGFISYTLLNILNGDLTRINLGTLLITFLGFVPLVFR